MGFSIGRKVTIGCFSRYIRRVAHSFKWSSVILYELAAIFVVGLFAMYLMIGIKPVQKSQPIPVVSTPTVTPTPSVFGTYLVPKIPRKDYYKIVMVGDSMTQLLGLHGGKLSEDLNLLFQSTPGHQRILIDNYAKGSTNILGLSAEMTTKGDYDPLLSSQFDMILIESFGYNPLSQLGITNGLEKQTETLNTTMFTLTRLRPNAAIVFVATIAPNKGIYAQQEGLINPIDRAKEADERMDYIKNHMAFATAHNIPLVDVFDKSLTANGDGNLLYINPTDSIHPSPTGIDFISNEIANVIYNSKILPQ